MEDVQVLKGLLILTRSGMKMSREHARAEDRYGIFDMLRNLAQQRFTSLGKDGRAHTRVNHFFSFYRLCLVGITVECAFEAADLPTRSDLADRLTRLEQDISITLEYFHAHRGSRQLSTVNLSGWPCPPPEFPILSTLKGEEPTKNQTLPSSS